MSDCHLRPSISKAAPAVPGARVPRGKSVIRRAGKGSASSAPEDGRWSLGRLQGGGGDFVAEPFPAAALHVEHADAGDVVPRIEDGEEASEMAGVTKGFAADPGKD